MSLPQPEKRGKKKPLPKRIAGRLLRLIAARPQGKPKLKPGELRRVLLMRYDKIGDMIITTPLIEALHRVAPGAEIDVLAGRANAGLIAADSRINQIFFWEKSLLKRIRVIRQCRARKYDLTLQLVLWRTTLPGLLAGLLTPAGRVVSRDDANNRAIFDHTVPIDASKHYSRQVFTFFAGSLELENGVPEMPPYSIRIPLESEKEVTERLKSEGLDNDRYLLLNISAGEKARELSHDQSVALVRRLAEIAEQHHLRVALTGAPNDADRIRAIIDDVKGKAVPLIFTSLLSAAAAIQRARLIITPDTGTNHIASAVGTPTVALFTKNGRPIGWGPLRVPHRIIQATQGTDASALTTEEIANGVLDLLTEITEGVH